MRFLLLLAFTAIGFGQITSIPGPSPDPSGGAVGGASSVAATQVLYGVSAKVAGSEAAFTYNATTDTLKVSNFVSGSATGTAQAEVYGAAQTTATITDAGATTSMIKVNSSNGSGGQGGAILFGGETAGGRTSQVGMKGFGTSTAGNGTADLAFYSRLTTAAIELSEIVRFTSAGNVGIGVTGPTYRLNVGRSGSSGTFLVKDELATTGATSVLFDIGAGQTVASTVFTINGIQKFAGTNSTGAGTALLGANSPAVTNSAPYTWIRIVTSDGSTAFIPAWK